MKRKPRLLVIAIILSVSIWNYTRIAGTVDIRTVEFLTIFAIGALTAILIREAIGAFKGNPDEK
ncbi:MAG TPA: hypothetical protein VK623_13095 [Flavobacterium sp.]|nr:hypothetical protein [Flavobacterium sp.]